MTLLLALSCLCVTGFVLMIHAALFAPEGYEDQSGFHPIETAKADASASAPSSLTTADLVFLGR